MLEKVTYTDGTLKPGWDSGRNLIVKSYPMLEHKLIVAELVNGVLEVYTFAKYLPGATINNTLIGQLYELLVKELLRQVADRSYVLVIGDETVIDCSGFKPLNVRWLGKGDPKPGLMPLCYDAKDSRWSAKVVVRVSRGKVTISGGLYAKVCVIIGKTIDISRIIEYLRLAESRTNSKITALHLCIAKPPIDELSQTLQHLTDVKYLIYQSGAIRCRSICSQEERTFLSINEVMDLPI